MAALLNEQNQEHEIYLVNKSANCRSWGSVSDVLRPIIINGSGNAKYNIWRVLSDQTAEGMEKGRLNQTIWNALLDLEGTGEVR